MSTVLQHSPHLSLVQGLTVGVRDDMQTSQWDQVDFKVLYPPSQQRGSRNDRSCVLKISSAYGAILLTGDIERHAEIALVRHYGEQIAADMLLAPHHGSRTSSTQTFIHYVSPQYVLFPSGYQNRFNFPASDVVARYQALGS